MVVLSGSRGELRESLYGGGAEVEIGDKVGGSGRCKLDGRKFAIQPGWQPVQRVTLQTFLFPLRSTSYSYRQCRYKKLGSKYLLLGANCEDDARLAKLSHHSIGT